MKKATRKMLPRKEELQWPMPVKIKTEKVSDSEEEDVPVLVHKVVKQYTRKKIEQPSVNKLLADNCTETEASAAITSEKTKVKEEVDIKEEMASGSDEDDKIITIKEEMESGSDEDDKIITIKEEMESGSDEDDKIITIKEEMESGSDEDDKIITIKEEMESGSDKDDKIITIKEEVETTIESENEVVDSYKQPTNNVDGLTEGEPSIITKKCVRRKDDTDFIKLKECYLVAVAPEPPKNPHRRRNCCRRQVALLEAKKVGTPENLPPFKLVANSDIFTCELCNKTFLSELKVRAHVRAAHSVAKDYKCEDCPASFPHNYLLLGHVRKHTGKPLDCDLCPKRFKKLVTYCNHLNTHLRERLFSCAVCLSRFTDIESLQRHALKHSPEDVFNCNTCDEKNHSRIHLRRHLEEVHGKKSPHPCYVCTRLLDSERDLYVHLQSHANAVYECAFCPKRFTDVSRWEDHSTGHIEKMKKNKSSVTHVYGCEICHKRFKYASILKTHMNSHGSERPYTCGICSKKYKTRSALIEHENGHRRPFACPLCGARFGKRWTMFRHYRTHSKRPYTDCSKLKMKKQTANETAKSESKKD